MLSNDYRSGRTWISTFGHFGDEAGHSVCVANQLEEDTSSLRFVFDTHTGENEDETHKSGEDSEDTCTEQEYSVCVIDWRLNWIYSHNVMNDIKTFQLFDDDYEGGEREVSRQKLEVDKIVEKRGYN